VAGPAPKLRNRSLMKHPGYRGAPNRQAVT
jgi:hypothetical protein